MVPPAYDGSLHAGRTIHGDLERKSVPGTIKDWTTPVHPLTGELDGDDDGEGVDGEVDGDGDEPKEGVGDGVNVRDADVVLVEE